MLSVFEINSILDDPPNNHEILDEAIDLFGRGTALSGTTTSTYINRMPSQAAFSSSNFSTGNLRKAHWRVGYLDFTKHTLNLLCSTEVLLFTFMEKSRL